MKNFERAFDSLSLVISLTAKMTGIFSISGCFFSTNPALNLLIFPDCLMFLDKNNCNSENIQTVFHLMLFAEISQSGKGTRDATCTYLQVKVARPLLLFSIYW